MKHGILSPNDSMEEILKRWNSYHDVLLERMDDSLHNNGNNPITDNATQSDLSFHTDFTPESMALALILEVWEESNSRLNQLLNGRDSETEFDVKADELAMDLEGFNLNYNWGSDMPMKRPELVFNHFRKSLINMIYTQLDGYSQLLISWLMFCKMRGSDKMTGGTEIPEASYLNKLYKVGDLVNREIHNVEETYLGLNATATENYWALA